MQLGVEDSRQCSSSAAHNLSGQMHLQQKYTGSWLWRTLSAAMEIDTIDKSPRNLAARFRVGLSEIYEALEGLVSLGILERTQVGFNKILKFVFFSDRQLNPRAVLADHVLVTTQILSRLDPKNQVRGSFYRTAFIATNKTLAKEFCLKVEAAMKEFMEKSKGVERDAIYALSFSAVNVLEEQGDANVQNN